MLKNIPIEKSYRYLGYFLMLLVPIVVVGFWRTYFGQFPGFKNLLATHHYHAVAASLWIILLVAQPILIQYKQLRWHRILGKVSYVVFPMLLLGLALMIQMNMASLQSLFVPAA